MQVRMQLGYWGGIWGTTRPQNVMVSKVNTISLVTVEVGNPRLVWRFSGTGVPRLLPPPPCCSAITMALSLFAREKAAHHYTTPSVGGKGKEGEKMIQALPSRERPRSHTLDFSSFPTGQNPVMQPHFTAREWEMQSQACTGVCPGASSVTVEKRGWMLK